MVHGPNLLPNLASLAVGTSSSSFGSFLWSPYVELLAAYVKLLTFALFAATSILRKPVIGFMHALVWWGFIVILFGTIEMIIDGLFGTERILSFMGPFYNFMMACGDIFAMIITIAIIVFITIPDIFI